MTTMVIAPIRFLLCVLLCLHPLTAIVVLGWLTRRMRRKITAHTRGQVSNNPGLVFLSRPAQPGFFQRLFGGLILNIGAGIKAIAAALIFTLPFSALWFFGWFAGWENSFSKGYEQAFFWPLISFSAVIVSVPLLTLFPMAIAHQAAMNRISSVIELPRIFALFRRTPWRNLGLVILITIGFAALLGVRALPTFAEHISQRVGEGDPEQVARYLVEVRLAATFLLVTGVLVLRSAIARVYARASDRLTTGVAGGTVQTGLCYLLCSAIWLAIVFSVFLAQFLNYNWISWFNQPVLMLPWLGSLS